jgi:hypothetical protein
MKISKAEKDFSHQSEADRGRRNTARNLSVEEVSKETVLKRNYVDNVAFFELRFIDSVAWDAASVRQLRQWQLSPQGFNLKTAVDRLLRL